MHGGVFKNVPIKLKNDSNFDSGWIGRWTKTLFAVIYKSRASLVLCSCISSQTLSVKISKKELHFTLWYNFRYPLNGSHLNFSAEVHPVC